MNSGQFLGKFDGQVTSSCPSKRNSEIQKENKGKALFYTQTHCKCLLSLFW